MLSFYAEIKQKFSPVPASPLVVSVNPGYSRRVFQLPNQLVKKLHELNPVVAKDLELSTDVSQNMYHAVFNPVSTFAKDIIPLYETHFTSDTAFLLETQQVILRMAKYSAEYEVPCDKIQTQWTNVKHDPKFIETYGYLDWEILESFNHSASVMQSLSLANMLSPIMSFFIPILFLIFPFILLKIQGVPISFTVYLTVLKSIAQHHFIGKALMSFDKFSVEKFLYLLGMIALYGLQMYQNSVQCIRFYRNTQKINDELCEWKAYVDHNVKSMKWFVETNKHLKEYESFCTIVESHCKTLELLKEELDPIGPFECSLYKTVEVGYMLKCYYQLHVNEEYEKSILFSMGFEGYLQLLSGVYENVKGGHLSFATFIQENEENEENEEKEEKEENEEKRRKFISQQYYPVHKNTDSCVRNDTDLDANMVITGPNASGKTTFLKTTALNILFSQQFGCGFYHSCALVPYTHIHSYLNIPDTSGRDSLFQAESRRCKEILNHIQTFTEKQNYRHFCIFDELYSGTNPLEATKAAYSFLEYIRPFKHVDLLLTTHYVTICDNWTASSPSKKDIENYQMLVQNGENEDPFTPLYLIDKGVSHIQGAIQILKEMDYPTEMIHMIQTCELQQNIAV
jgi:energy-coupling factor transporter ATP-binding protein EcfA2